MKLIINCDFNLNSDFHFYQSRITNYEFHKQKNKKLWLKVALNERSDIGKNLWWTPSPVELHYLDDSNMMSTAEIL